MPELDVLTVTGKKKGRVDLPGAWFAAKVNDELMAQAVRVYLANQRKARAKSKGRGEIAMTTRKWYRQKGTGRARHGAKSAPIFVGGGKAHGPSGEENFSLVMPKKMRRAALASALTSLHNDGKVLVVDGLDKLEPKTSLAAQIVEAWKLDSKFVLVMPEKLENVRRAFRNLKNSKLELVNQLNTYKVLNSGTLVLMKEAVERLGEKDVRSSDDQQSEKAIRQKVKPVVETNSTEKEAKKFITKRTSPKKRVINKQANKQSMQ